MGEIAAASEEQSGGIDQVARAVTQMDEVTQQNAALVEEAAAAASSLEDQAGKLRTAVAVFQLDEGGYKAPAKAPANASAKASAKAPASAAPKRALAPARPMGGRKIPSASSQPAPHGAAATKTRAAVAPTDAPAKTTAAASAGGAQDWETF
jgi:methyl-accepting chemotaxis protein-1 (serine sensor receptor)